MEIVVITGSTRGIGYGLADSFLSLGCAVTISGRSRERIETAVSRLAATHDSTRLFGVPCDVTSFEQLQALWDAAKAYFGKIDIWINNAGVGHPQADFWNQSAVQVEAVVNTNMIGTMYGSIIALRGMMEQRSGSLYNMEGLGSDGRIVHGLAIYGSTKSGVGYLTRSLAKETANTPIIVGGVRPGMVVTELLTGQYKERPEEWEQAKRIFNVLADRVEVVTPWLAKQVLANRKNGVVISWLTRRKVLIRFLLAPFRRRELFDL